MKQVRHHMASLGDTGPRNSGLKSGRLFSLCRTYIIIENYRKIPGGAPGYLSTIRGYF
ncbi:hypothetical protein Holit_00063 [Hollandina sp. SP2]